MSRKYSSPTCGSFGFDFEAIYDEVIDQEKITYTIADGRQVTTVFENLDDKTKVTTTFKAETENPVEQQREGWGIHSKQL